VMYRGRPTHHLVARAGAATGGTGPLLVNNRKFGDGASIASVVRALSVPGTPGWPVPLKHAAAGGNEHRRGQQLPNSAASPAPAVAGAGGDPAPGGLYEDADGLPTARSESVLISPMAGTGAGEGALAAGAGEAAKPKEPRRRKLVRGGNAVVTPVLPEFTMALSALDDLDAFLDEMDTEA